MITALQRQLAQAIRQNIYQDFAERHVTGNLMNTIEVIYGEDEVRVRVPAVRYDQKEWSKSKAIILLPHEGSYANQVDVTGGWSRTHQNYADMAITSALNSVLGMMGEDAYEIEVR